MNGIKASVLEIFKRHGHEENDVAGSNNLFEDGIIDSIFILELISELELLTGKTYDFDALVTENFLTLDKILEVIRVEQK